MKYPNMRLELIGYLQSLADARHPPGASPSQNDSAGVRAWLSVDCAMSFILDDINSTEKPDSMIGVFLRNADEAKLVSSVGYALLEFVNALKRGVDASRAELLWSEVRQNARLSLQRLLS